MQGAGTIRQSRQPLHIGCRYTAPTTRGAYAGLIDEVRIYSRVLNEVEIRELARGSGHAD